MMDKRHKNSNWDIGVNSNNRVSFDGAQLAVLMDIRDELQEVNRRLSCYRIPKALDAAIELGADARRRKRLAAARRKAARERAR